MEICHLAVSLNHEMQLVACNITQQMMNHSMMETVILCMLTLFCVI